MVNLDQKESPDYDGESMDRVAFYVEEAGVRIIEGVAEALLSRDSA